MFQVRKSTRCVWRLFLYFVVFSILVRPVPASKLHFPRGLNRSKQRRTHQKPASQTTCHSLRWWFVVRVKLQRSNCFSKRNAKMTEEFSLEVSMKQLPVTTAQTGLASARTVVKSGFYLHYSQENNCHFRHIFVQVFGEFRIINIQSENSKNTHECHDNCHVSMTQ